MCGVGIIIEVICKNNLDYDFEGVDVNVFLLCCDFIYFGIFFCFFVDYVLDFMSLIMNLMV